MLTFMDDAAIIKRITAIGAELVALERKRNEIDNQTRALLREAHRLTRPRREANPEPTGDAAMVPDGAPILVRNGEVTLRVRLLRLLTETGRAMTKYEGAQTLGLSHMQIHYCLVSLKKQGLVSQPAQGSWVITDRGKATVGKVAPAMPVITVEAED
jgi:hypothetical protein